MPLASAQNPEISHLVTVDHAYADGAAELADHFARLHHVLRNAVQRFRLSHNAGVDAALGSIAVFDSEIDAFLSAPPARNAGMPGNSDLKRLLNDGRRNCQRRSDASTLPATELPVAMLRSRFQLSATETDVLLLCAAWELHPGYGRLFAYLHNNLARTRPSIALILDVFSGDWSDRLALRRALSPESPLLRHGLITPLSGDGPLLEIAIDPPVLDILLGQSLADHMIEVPGERLDRLLMAPRERDKLSGIAAWLSQAEPKPAAATVIVLDGPEASGRRTAAAAVSARAGYRLFAYEPVIEASPALSPLRTWLRNVRILGGLPLLRLSDNFAERQDGLAELAHCLRDCGCPASFLIAGAGTGRQLHWPDFIHADLLELEPPSAELRREAWRRALRGRHLKCAEEHLKSIAAVYPLAAGSIWRAADTVADRQTRNGSKKSRIERADLAEACRAQTIHRLGRLGQRLVASHGWDDIILPADEMRRLREIADAVRNRDLVRQQWGFDKIGFGRGISALFFGPSGTGKTMAASILANDLEMEIYRIDLSRVVSKYIGETEKNLDAIFEEARRACALLFFDEAEALFGKRSEVKDAHDRYSNIEMAYLLQRIEVFDGVAVLSTNLRNNMDSAFARRLQFAVEFPFPTQTDRLRIWQQAWPKAVQLGAELDLDFMARTFELAGGHIRNIALTAAYLAAQHRGPISMTDLIAATRREFQKIGHLCIAEQFGKYAHLAKATAP